MVADSLMLKNRFFSLRIIQMWIVMSSNEVDLLMLWNRVLRLRNVQKFAVPSRKGVELLMLRNGVFSLRIGQIWVMLSCKGAIKSFFGIVFSGCEICSYVLCQIARRQIF